jgi:hypothetical protein
VTRNITVKLLEAWNKFKKFCTMVTFGDLIIVKKKRRIAIRHSAEVRGDVIIIIITRIAIVK